MTLEKAIEVLTRITDEARPNRRGEHWLAIKLGIEALKRLQHTRHDLSSNYRVALPGETKED